MEVQQMDQKQVLLGIAQAPFPYRGAEDWESHAMYFGSLTQTKLTASVWDTVANALHSDSMKFGSTKYNHFHSIVYTIPFVLEAPEAPGKQKTTTVIQLA